MANLDIISEFKSSPKMLEKLQSFGIHKTFAEGETILRENAHIRAIPIVLEGAVKVIRTDDEGREILLYYIRPGESCVMSFLGGLHHETSKIKAVTDDKTEILFIPVEQVAPMLKEFPQWLDYFFRLYHKRFEELLEVVNAIAFKKMDERLLDFLKKKAGMLNSRSIAVTHEQLANDLGTARVVVSRLLKQMEDEGLVKLARNKITLL